MQNQLPEKNLKPFIKIVLRYILIFLVYIAIANIAIAQNKDTVKISDLTFSCENCQLDESANSCNLLLKNENIIFPCAQALDYFFSILKTSDHLSQYPSALELKNYIFSANKSKSNKVNALNILLKKDDGRKLFLEDIAAFNLSAATYYSEVIPFSFQYSEIWKAVWSSPSFEDPKIDAEVRSKIFAYLEIPTAELFKDTLYSSLLDQTLINQKEIVELYKANCQGKKNDVVEQLAIIKDFLENCSNINSILSNTQCLENNINEASKDTITLISKLKFNLVLNEIKKADSFKGQDIINLLSKTNYQIIRTPDSHYTLFKAFESLAKNNYCESRKVFYQYQDLFNEYQKYDPGLSELLNTAGETTCDLVEETLAKRRERLFYALTIFIVMLITIWIIKRRAPQEVSKELSELLIYFNISLEEKDKLSEMYHFLAKKFHPDSGTGSDELFKELNKKYERIKILL